ncbi:MAG: FHA domain-containing protein [Myxococcales bacterium]|nr:FHA domain-containing protein [Myxococcales bacterium]MCB9531843.1 FHA domain-containing protein [Myxococcales bacterium]
MFSCTSCGKENEDHYKFCLGCGANLEAQRKAKAQEGAEPRFCPSCGAETSPGQRFCGSCGFKIDENGAAAKAAPAGKGGAKAAPAAKAAAPKPTPGNSPAALVMVNPDGSAGDVHDLAAGENLIGRSCGDHIFERDPYLSPEHASFVVSSDSVKITDLNSLNGVYYRITEVTELQHGDYIRVGHELLRFQLLDLADADVLPATDGTVVAGSAALGAWGKLERISAPDTASLTFLLRGAEAVLGRERGDILFRDDGYVSGKHARVFQDSGRYFVEDLKSSNGTFMRIRGDRTVGNGALLLLGQQPFRVMFR